jgi:hypothetical protein
LKRVFRSKRALLTILEILRSSFKQEKIAARNSRIRRRPRSMTDRRLLLRLRR